MACMHLIAIGFVLRIEVNDVQALVRAIGRVDQLGLMTQLVFTPPSVIRQLSHCRWQPAVTLSARVSGVANSPRRHHALDFRDLGCDIFAYELRCCRRAAADRRMAYR